MDKQLQAALLSAMLCRQGQTEITVTGYSMEPTFFEGDRITIAKSDSYAVGDILVFTDHGNLLVHRLLETGEYYLCKGDNAFRTESIPAAQILGKVISVSGRSLEAWPAWKIVLSHRVNAAFRAHDYSIAKTKPTPIYRAYSALVLQKEDPTMKYQKNSKMDYIQTDEASLAVFDPESGDTHFFDEVGIDILNCLAEPTALDELLAKLCAIYSATPDDIRADVVEFLGETVEKGVVLAV